VERGLLDRVREAARTGNRCSTSFVNGGFVRIEGGDSDPQGRDETIPDRALGDLQRAVVATGNSPGSQPSSDVEPQQSQGVRLRDEAFMALPDAALVADSDLLIRFVNPAAERLFGISADEAIGAHIVGLLETEADSPPTNDEITLGIQRVLEGISWSGHIKRKNAEGQWRDVEAMAIAISPTRGTQGLLCIARDITPIQQAAREANDRTEFAAAVLESLPGRTCVIDATGHVVEVNRKYRDQGPTGAGVNTGPGIGDDYVEWLTSTVSRSASSELRELLNRERADYRAEFATSHRRRRTWTEMFAVPLTRLQPGAVVTHGDITTRKNAESALEKRATHDPLTGLPNRVLLADRLAHGLSRATRTQTQIGLLFCDLDGFREVNNQLGHLAGDKLLVTIAKRLRAVCRSSDTVARVSGDEFVIVLEDVAGREEIEEVARRIIEALDEPIELEHGTAQTGTSIGLVISSGVPRAGARTVQNLIRDADSAMYAAKEAGRGRYAWFIPEMRERPRERPTFVQAIGRLLNR
jgi:diguanylate cyclase (GGDEF)-like protein/PAS domain S-box-containing protein